MSQVKRKQLLPQDEAVLLRPTALKFNLALLDQSLARDSLAEFCPPSLALSHRPRR